MKTDPRILSLELVTAAPLAEMKAFYHRTLGLAARVAADTRAATR